MDTETESTEGTTESTEQTFVEIPESSDEDLDAFLESPEAQEAQPDEDESEEIEESEHAETLEEGEPAAKEPENGDNITLSKAEYDELVTKLEKKQQHNKNLEQFVQRRSTEIGTLRKDLQERDAKLKAWVDEFGDDNPAKAAEVAIHRHRIKENLQGLNQEEQLLEKRVAVQQAYEAYRPEGVELRDMAELLLDDGVPREHVEAFVRDPYGVSEGSELVHLARRAEAVKRTKQIAQIIPYAKHLQKENEELRRQLKLGPQKVVKKIESALKNGPTITSATGKTKAKATVSSSDVSRMSDSELEQLLGS